VILQHGDDGPPAHFSAWCERRGIPFETRRVWEGELPADPVAYRWICSLGSDETPGREGRPEWVDDEIEFLRDAIEADVPVLGLCFGGQALACAAGGGVAPAEPAEVGWLAIESSVPDQIPAGPWLHFHYDQLRLPEGATELARSPAGTAAFRSGRNLGLQFHPEATPAIADEWAQAEVLELARIGVTPEEVAEQGILRGDAAAVAAERLFDSWWESLES
jgi:GMP synthase-like glutamine amidotransferase